MEAVWSKGTVARQAHVGVPDGTYEEEHGRDTFFGRSSHLYRLHPPTAWVAIDGPLRPRALEELLDETAATVVRLPSPLPWEFPPAEVIVTACVVPAEPGTPQSAAS